jgi:acetyltransferase-like isoleucine patch superfamily enzyme
MRVIKYLWFHFIMMVTGWLPDLRPVLRFRGFLLKRTFRSCGDNLQVARNVTINFTSRVEIGSDVFLALGCWLQAQGGIVLEDEVQIGPYAVLASGDHVMVDGSYRSEESELAPIRINHGSWVAAHATVTKGVVMGRGALLAANSVATHDVPPFTVVAGVPARPLHGKSRIAILR